MAKRARLRDLSKELKKPAARKPKGDRIEANPERGERGDFLRVTVTLPAELITELRSLGLSRRTAGRPNTTLSALLREAAVALLEADK